MSKFKVGDRVRVLSDGLSTTGAAGMLGYVRGVIEGCDRPLIQVELDEGGAYESVAHPDMYRWSWFDEPALEVVSEAVEAPSPWSRPPESATCDYLRDEYGPTVEMNPVEQRLFDAVRPFIGKKLEGETREQFTDALTEAVLDEILPKIPVPPLDPFWSIPISGLEGFPTSDDPIDDLLIDLQMEFEELIGLDDNSPKAFAHRVRLNSILYDLAELRQEAA